MDNNDNGSGLFGGLILGMGFAGILLLPIILMRRFGIEAMGLFSSIAMTGFAIAHPTMVAWVTAEQNLCDSITCPANALLGMLTILPTWGWWLVAIGGWALMALQAWLAPYHPSSV